MRVARVMEQGTPTGGRRRKLGRGLDALLGDGPPFVRVAGARALATELADQEILDGVVEGWRWPEALRVPPPDRLEVEALTRAVTCCAHPEAKRFPGPTVMVFIPATEGPRGALERFASDTVVCGACGMWRRDQPGLHYPRPWRRGLDQAVAEGVSDG